MRAMVLNDGETFTGVSGCKIVEVDDSYVGDEADDAIEAVCEGGEVLGRILYAFTGDETGGVALTPALDQQVRVALSDSYPRKGDQYYALLALAKACDIEIPQREKP